MGSKNDKLITGLKIEILSPHIWPTINNWINMFPGIYPDNNIYIFISFRTAS